MKIIKIDAIITESFEEICETINFFAGSLYSKRLEKFFSTSRKQIEINSVDQIANAKLDIRNLNRPLLLTLFNEQLSH